MTSGGIGEGGRIGDWGGLGIREGDDWGLRRGKDWGLCWGE